MNGKFRTRYFDWCDCDYCQRVREGRKQILAEQAHHPFITLGRKEYKVVAV